MSLWRPPVLWWSAWRAGAGVGGGVLGWAALGVAGGVARAAGAGWAWAAGRSAPAEAAGLGSWSVHPGCRTWRRVSEWPSGCRTP
jgi:hypothetical protein